MSLDVEAAREAIAHARRGAARADASRRRRGASTASSTRTWPAPRACTPPSAATTPPACRCSRSAAPGRCTRSASARALGTTTVIVPAAAGVMSSVGVLAAPLATDGVRSRVEPVDDDTLDAHGAAVRRARAGGRSGPVVLGCERDHARALDRHALRRPGLRGHRPGRAGRGSAVRVRGRVRALARPQGSGRADRGDQLAGLDPRTGPRPAPRRGGCRTDAPRRGAEGHARRVVRRRLRLPPRSTTATGWARARGSTGPAIVEERESTIVVGPGATARVADDGSLIIERWP